MNRFLHFAGLILALVLPSGCSDNTESFIVRTVENGQVIRDLGGGFDLRVVAVSNASSFEAVSFFQAVFHEGRRLAECPHIAPSKQFAVYSRWKDGILVLYDTGSRTEKIVQKIPAYPTQVTWDLTNWTVDVTFTTNHGETTNGPVTIQLKKNEWQNKTPEHISEGRARPSENAQR